MQEMESLKQADDLLKRLGFKTSILDSPPAVADEGSANGEGGAGAPMPTQS